MYDRHLNLYAILAVSGFAHFYHTVMLCFLIRPILNHPDWWFNVGAQEHGAVAPEVTADLQDHTLWWWGALAAPRGAGEPCVAKVRHASPVLADQLPQWRLLSRSQAALLFFTACGTEAWLTGPWCSPIRDRAPRTASLLRENQWWPTLPAQAVCLHFLLALCSLSFDSNCLASQRRESTSYLEKWLNLFNLYKGEKWEVRMEEQNHTLLSDISPEITGEQINEQLPHILVCKIPTRERWGLTKPRL